MQLSNTVRDSILDAIDDDIGATGRARFYTASLTTLLASCPLNNPAFAAASAGTMALDVTPAVEDTSPAAAGTAARVTFYTNATATSGAWLLQLGVATSGTPDITMSNTTIATTDTVQISSLSLQCPAGTPDVT